MAFRYQNTSGAPVIVPGKRGVGVMFRPGEYSTDQWFSKCCGPRMLTAVPIVEPVTKPAPATSVSPPASPPVISAKPGVIEKETSDYLRKNGIYHCKACDIFRTGSIRAMEIHLEDFHHITPSHKNVVKEAEETIVVNTRGQTDLQTAAQQLADVTNENVLVDTSNLTSASPPNPGTPALETEPASPGDENVLQCPKCERQFSSDRGLKAHLTRSHSDSV